MVLAIFGDTTFGVNAFVQNKIFTNFVKLRNYAVLIKLARFYNTSIDYLLGETDQKERYPKK